MSESKSGAGVPFNLTTVVALFTLVGGLWVVSKSVKSDRPNSPADTPFQSTGNQDVQARLWEDPLGWHTNESQAYGEDAFNLLRRQIATDNNHPILLPVMMEGGPYSEDHETRIRSRYAIISALGESGYAPDDEDHVGAITISWPTTTDLAGWLANQASSLRLRPATLSSFSCCGTGKAHGLDDNSSYNGSPASGVLRIGFEWYHSRVFTWGSRLPPKQRLLVLWLDEDQFDDCPQARLALLLNELANAGAQTDASNDCSSITGLFEKIDLIGPRTSTTLHAMLPEYGMANYDTNSFCTNLQKKVHAILRLVDVFCPTPSAMDAVLVTNCANELPRQPVENILTNFWFNSFHNFCATDAQLAKEAFEELQLRRIDLTDTNQNVVLISEWDTFYGRMLSLTYAAELAKFQHPDLNDAQFVSNYLGGGAVWPTNLTCFTYLRGLDGQTTKRDSSGSSPTNRPESPSLENLVAGDPNESKAEGQAQFDYMNRLGERIKKLERDLIRQGHGHIDAVGICGSDPYDTLVILQVLRPDFPNAVFFTTDLDARFAHPTEQDWARNLIVLSSYGFQLDAKLQGSVAPFRDSDQTAQFAATLAAIGDTNFPWPAVIPPRRFEIGKDQAFDLSISNGGLVQPPPAVGHSTWGANRLIIMLAVVSGGFLIFCSSRRLQCLTWDATQHEIKCLWFGLEDVGGKDGVDIIVRQLKEFAHYQDDPVAGWLWKSFDQPGKETSGQKAPPNDPQVFLDFLNQVVLQSGVPLDDVLKSPNITQEIKEEFRQMAREKQSQGVFFARNSVRQMRLNRKILDELFFRIFTSSFPAASAEEYSEMKELAETAKNARLAGEQEYLLRHDQRWWSWFGWLLLLAVLWLVLRTARHDSLPGSGGEPFLFFAGISDWPTVLLRLLAVVLAVLFIGKSYNSSRSGVLNLSRSYRLPLMEKSVGFFKWRLPSTPPPQATVDATNIWEHYQQLGRFWQRLTRVVPPFVGYLVFCFSITFWLGGPPYSPVRGTASYWWCIITLYAAVITSLFLAFWIIDAACLCRWLIERFSESPTRYPKSCLRFFAEQCGLRAPNSVDDRTKDAKTGGSNENESILAEWIDMKLIAELTGRVGQLVYFPFIVFFVMIVSRNELFDRWPWPPCLIIVFGLNLSLCVASMVILRQSALKARDVGLENLRARVNALKREAAASPEANHAIVGQRLLEDLETLDKGAFAPLWENPLIAAILIPSGGSVLIEVLSHVFH